MCVVIKIPSSVFATYHLISQRNLKSLCIAPETLSLRFDSLDLLFSLPAEVREGGFWVKPKENDRLASRAEPGDE